MTAVPVWDRYDSPEDARLVITALRNESYSLQCLRRFDAAAALNARADRIERKLFSIAPLVTRSVVTSVVDDGPIVRRITGDYTSKPLIGGVA